MYNDLRKIIREIIEDELDEVSTSAGAGPYNSPYAFSGNVPSARTKRKESATKSGFHLVDKEADIKSDKI